MVAQVFKDELYTVVENMTGVEKVFGYLGPRGMRLGVGEVVAIPGDLRATLGAKTSQRKFNALRDALNSGKLRIRNTPAPILWDSVDDTPKSLAVSGGALGLVDPTYNSSTSDSYDAV
jgi:hypothetical protein